MRAYYVICQGLQILNKANEVTDISAYTVLNNRLPLS